MLVTKRDGTLQEFDENKILKSILACFDACDDKCYEIESVVQATVTCAGSGAATVSGIQDCTERTLIEYGYHEAAACFMAYRIEKDLIREIRLKPDASALQEYIHQGKYAHWLPEHKRREDYSENVDRVIEMHYRKFLHLDSQPGPNIVQQEITTAFRYVYAKSILPSMRSMQFAGPAIAKNHARMYNCCFTHIDRVEAFQETLFLLLSGCGVGYSVQWEHVDLLPTVNSVDRVVRHYTIADSIEGWSDAVGALLSSYMDVGVYFGDQVVCGHYVEFDYSKIRAEGTLLKISGGCAPGHLGLKAMLEEIRAVLQAAQGRKLRPIEAHDMMCYIARAVLSGGIRRSSMISLFSASDTEMMYAKARGVFDPRTGLNDQRQMANNTAVLLRNTVTRAIFDRILELSNSGFGDPGFVFLDNSDEGINPCAEIKLNPVLDAGEPSGVAFCNLATINASTCQDKSDFVDRCDAAATIATLQSCFTDFGYLHPRSQAIAERDRLIGVSITGIMDNPAVMDWLRHGHLAVMEANTRVAKLLGIGVSARVCCIKPEGTASLMLGTSSGIHCHHSRRYLRRVTVNRTEVVGAAFRAVNPHMVEEKPNGDYCIVFPVQARDDAIVDICGVEFLENVHKVLTDWCTLGGHNVSCTVPIPPGSAGLDEVIDYIWNHKDTLSCLAFCPSDISTRYPFAPLEKVVGAVLEAYWDQLCKNYTPVVWNEIGEDTAASPLDVAACDSGKCSVNR